MILMKTMFVCDESSSMPTWGQLFLLSLEIRNPSNCFCGRKEFLLKACSTTIKISNLSLKAIVENKCSHSRKYALDQWKILWIVKTSIYLLFSNKILKFITYITDFFLFIFLSNCTMKWKAVHNFIPNVDIRA